MSKTNPAAQKAKRIAFRNASLPGFEVALTPADDAKEKDFYPTPKHALKSIIPKVKNWPIWEPCCGDRRLITWLNEAGFTADGADIRDAISYDFLRDNSTHSCILTNPPFSLAEEFVTHARSHAIEVFMLLPLSFLGTQARADWWKANEPNALFVLSKRPSFTSDGKTDSAEYAWYYWGDRLAGIHHV